MEDRGVDKDEATKIKQMIDEDMGMSLQDGVIDNVESKDIGWL